MAPEGARSSTDFGVRRFVAAFLESAGRTCELIAAEDDSGREAGTASNARRRRRRSIQG